ncbi:MAG: hypothetical protein SNG10_00685 [Rikenellaceae bacterium]
MIYKLSRLLLMLTLIVASVTSCSEDYPNYRGLVTYEKSGLYFNKWGESQTTTFKLDNVANLELDYDYDDWTEGWDVELNFYQGTVKVTAPKEPTYDSSGNITNQYCEVSIRGETHDGYSVYTTLTMGVVEYVYLDDEGRQSNSIIVTEPGKFYVINASYKGEDDSATIEGIYDSKLIWSGGSTYRGFYSSVCHVQLLSPTQLAFYVDYDEEDLDNDGIEDDIIHGNALVGVLDSSGEVLWSWHIWCRDEYPGEVTLNGTTFMDVNLGADITCIENDSTIYHSYGLYYQWGRKDPFTQPLEYNASGGYDGILYSDGTQVFLSYEESTSSVGTLEYATQNPMTYIYAEEDGYSDYDWLYSNQHNENLWSDSAKSIYDPSPKGWRIPKSTDFDNLEMVTPLPDKATDADSQYGAYLTDGVTEALFMGCGRRTYITGRVSNINSNYFPWTGYYWTSTATVDDKSDCYKFDNLELVELQHPAYRANGMQIRCVKDTSN